jgi:chemotaxis protein CheX
MGRTGTEAAPALPGGGSRLVLASRLALGDAAALVAALQGQRGRALEIDASGVVEIGTPCLQVLLSAAASWRGDGQDLRVLEPSAGFLATLGHLGLDLDTLGAGGAAA